MTTTYDRTLVVGKDNRMRRFPWGKVIHTHLVGDYAIVEYIPSQASNVSDEDYAEQIAKHPRMFHIEGASRSYHSLDAALVGCVALKHDGINTRADGYFMRMIGADQ